MTPARGDQLYVVAQWVFAPVPFLNWMEEYMLSDVIANAFGMQLLNLTWGALASVAAGIILEKLKIESKPIQASCG